MTDTLPQMALDHMLEPTQQNRSRTVALFVYDVCRDVFDSVMMSWKKICHCNVIAFILGYGKMGFLIGA